MNRNSRSSAPRVLFMIDIRTYRRRPITMEVMMIKEMPTPKTDPWFEPGCMARAANWCVMSFITADGESCDENSHAEYLWVLIG
jgi:hypothetical protein